MRKEKRFGWIAASLEMTGKFGPAEKKPFMTEFDISHATVSRDQAEFFKLVSMQGTVRLEAGKLEVVNGQYFTPPEGIICPSRQEWLRLMLGTKYVKIAKIYQYGYSSQTLGALFESISNAKSMSIWYQANTDTFPKWRAISPHTIVEVKDRLQARCYDHEDGIYADFFVDQIRKVTIFRNDLPNYVNARLDHEWLRLKKSKYRTE